MIDTVSKLIKNTGLFILSLIVITIVYVCAFIFVIFYILYILFDYTRDKIIEYRERKCNDLCV